MFRKGGQLALLASLLAACGAGSGSASDATCASLQPDQLASAPLPACPDDLPTESACAAATPSYATDIAPLIEARCGACHDPGQLSASFPLAPYAKLYDQRRSVLNQIFTCKMPPACAHELAPEERAALLGWFVCGALDN